MTNIDVEKSKVLVAYGIIAFEDGTYYRIKPLSIEESKFESVEGEPEILYSLIPLTNKEKKKYGIIEESAQTVNNELDIEESESGTESEVERKLRLAREQLPKQGEPNLHLSGDKNAVEAAKRILENAQAKQKGEPTKDELLDENEHLKTSIQLLSEKEAIRRVDALGIKDNDLRNDLIEHPDKINAYKKGLNREGLSSPSGSAPLNAAQMGQSDSELWKRPFSSTEEMLRFLRDNAKDDLTAKQYYDEMWRRAIFSMKSKNALEYKQPYPDIPNEGGGDITIRNWGQLKGGKSEIREALDRANEIAREKIRHEYDRRMKKKEVEQ